MEKGECAFKKSGDVAISRARLRNERIPNPVQAR
jgi:hypothetical protein